MRVRVLRTVCVCVSKWAAVAGLYLCMPSTATGHGGEKGGGREEVEEEKDSAAVLTDVLIAGTNSCDVHSPSRRPVRGHK